MDSGVKIVSDGLHTNMQVGDTTLQITGLLVKHSEGDVVTAEATVLVEDLSIAFPKELLPFLRIKVGDRTYKVNNG